MRQNFNNFQNYDINNMMKYLTIFSFIVQWSFLSMILNLFTMGIIRFPLFILFILDALTMISMKNKTIKRPSFILSKIWNIIDFITLKRNNQVNTNQYNNNSVVNTYDNVTSTFRNISNKINNTINNIRSWKINNKKYDKERKINKFPDKIGKKVIIEYISPDEKLKRKTFEYKDRAITYMKMLESNGYKNYSVYSVNPNIAPAYMIFNKDKDIVDLENMQIKLKKDDKNYKFVTDGWPKK